MVYRNFKDWTFGIVVCGSVNEKCHGKWIIGRMAKYYVLYSLWGVQFLWLSYMCNSLRMYVVYNYILYFCACAHNVLPYVFTSIFMLF